MTRMTRKRKTAGVVKLVYKITQIFYFRGVENFFLPNVLASFKTENHPIELDIPKKFRIKKLIFIEGWATYPADPSTGSLAYATIFGCYFTSDSHLIF